MNHGSGLLSLVRTIGLALTLGVSMIACAQINKSGADTWKEEVLLHDGQKIIVERSQSYGGRSEPGQSGPIKEHAISFTLPGSNKPITWTSDYSEELGRTNFNLLAVHALNGIPYIVASPNLCLSYNKWGRPNPPYVFFKLEGNAWQRIPLEQFPAEFKTINVVLSIQKFQADQLSSTGLTSAEKIKELNAHIEKSEHKTIVREPLSKERIDQMCGDLILYKGAWIMRNDPVARKMVDQNSNKSR
jgi:hypothetical protein